MGMLAKLNQWRRGEARKEILKKYQGEPIFTTMEKLMLKMKNFYAKNGWIFLGKETMAILNSMRDEYEKSLKKIEIMAGEQKKQAHDNLEEKMNRQIDKKMLVLQYKAMQREYHTIRKLGKLNKNKYVIPD